MNFRHLMHALHKRLFSGWLEGLYLELIRNIDGETGDRLRFRYYRKRGLKIGRGARIDTGVFLYGPQYIKIGSNSHIDKNCIIIGSPSDINLSARIVKERMLEEQDLVEGEVRIGRNCHISQNCMIYGYGGVKLGDSCVMSAGAKVYSLTSMANDPGDPARIVSIVPYDGISPTLKGKVVMEDNVWIGLDVIVSPGVRIGRDSFVRSRSMVMSSFPSNSYIAGDPAVSIRKRFAPKDQV